MLELHFRSSLGLASYHVGNLGASHEFYMQENLACGANVVIRDLQTNPLPASMTLRMISPSQETSCRGRLRSCGGPP